MNQQRQVVEEVAELRPAATASASRRAASRNCWPWWRWPTNDTPIICNGFKDAEFIEMAMLAQKIGRQIIPVVEKYTELELILEYAEKVGVRPQHRHARQAGRPRRRPLAVVRRLPLEVRPDGHRDPARARGAEDARHGGLLQAAALPSGQPDHQHPHHQGGAERGGAHLRANWSKRAPASSTWTSAAASASTTTARRPTSSRA